MVTYQNFFDLSLRFISFRPRSEKELKDFLKRKKVGEETMQKILTKLKELDFINDEKFTKWWIDQRQTFKQKGMHAIKMELLQKGIGKETIEKVLEQPNEGKSEKDLARITAGKKAGLYKKLPKLEFKQKLSQFLARKGFGWDTIGEVVDEIVKKEYNTNY